MTIKTFFTIIAVLALAHGAGFVMVPEQVSASYGMAISPATLLMARLFGAALLGLGLIFWFARNGSRESVRSVFIATVIGNTVGLIVVVLGTMAGTLNSMGWIAALIYLFGAAGSAYYLMTGSPQLSSRQV
jgi:vacuolar-type H+-ATPase subunit I/STV1